MIKKEKSLDTLERKIFPYLLIAPNMLIFLLFIAIPAVYGMFLSFTDWNGFSNYNFIGLKNYITVIKDTKFWDSFIRTVIYVCCALPFILTIPLFLANLMIKEIRCKGLFRALLYWPAMISYVIVGISFKFIFGDNTGVINFLLQTVGLQKVDWLTNGTTAMIVVILATIWSRSGFYMITYMTGLQNIPVSYYEASEIDGANSFQRFIWVTLPQLRPTSFLVLILGFIDLFKAYGLVLSLTGGGPGVSTKFVVQYVYDKAFGGEQKMGYASALSMVLLVVMAIFALLQFKVNDREE